jgi:two-component system cell cycle sensor histidine kinase/response regulator CckA
MPAKQRQKVKRMPAPCMDAPAVQALRHQIELKIQHAHLRQSREDHSTVANELTTFFNLIPDLVCIASPDGYFKRLNPAWEALLGYTQAELLATPIFDLIHPEDREGTQAEIARQTSGHWTTQFVNRYRCKDGSYRWLEWTAAPTSSLLGKTKR